MRVINPNTVCLRLQTGAVIQADLKKPLSPRSHVRGQSINVLKPLPAMIQLGTFDLDHRKFMDTLLEVDLPEVRYERVTYMSRKKNS